MKKILFGILLVIIFVSCTSTYKYDFNNPSEEILEINKNIAITVSEDGAYGNDVYTGSGRKVSNTIRIELKKYTTNIEILKDKVSLKDLSDQESYGYDYIIVPEIIHWEDRATAWSGIPDKVEISIEIFDENRNLLKSAILSGKSSTMTLSANDPSELLEKPIEEFLKSVFEK